MKNIPKGNGRHLTLSERTYIEQDLLQGSTFRFIAQNLHKDPSTISKEIKSHFDARYIFPKCKECRLYPTCKMRSFCFQSNCKELCFDCKYNLYVKHCKDYDPFKCDKLRKPPYVYNGCDIKLTCHEHKRYYHAPKAQKEYEKTISKSRIGINMTAEKLQELNDLISPLILKGQPLSHIFAVHSDEIPVCRRTLYNYLDQWVFQARNIDLPRHVRYKKRKKRSEPRTSKSLKQEYRNKRTYVDFERFMNAHPDVDVVEMDTVKLANAFLHYFSEVAVLC